MQRIVFFVLLIITTNIFSQNSNLFIPLDVLEAYENGTRTYDGTVSDNYWVNHTDYIIDVEFFPDSDLIVGSAKITYFNESPDSLSRIVLRLYQNIVKPGVVKDWNIPEELLKASGDLIIDGSNYSWYIRHFDLFREEAQLKDRVYKTVQHGAYLKRW